jgi:UDP:flavonoid glycosyltransferase YjiC (YdhE family)
MRVLLVSRGSTGDIFPLIAFGKALLAAGHAVSFATDSIHAAEIRAAGIAFVLSPPDCDAAGHAAIMRKLSQQRNPLLNITAIFEWCAPGLPEFVAAIDDALHGHDVLVSTYLFPFLGSVARRQNKPFVVTAFCHVAFPGLDRAPVPLPPLDFAPKFVRHAWADFWHRTGEFLTGACVRSVAGKALAKTGTPLPKRFFKTGADLTLALVSPALFRPERPLAEKLLYAGYLRWVLPESPKLEAKLRAFTGGERTPVLNFGSVTFDGAEEQMESFLENWPRGRRLIVQSGWAGFTAEGRDDILVVTGKVSHDQLFRHASVVAHHGGAGTTAAALHAGVPQVVVPHLGDQFFWASEMCRLGVGVEVSSRRWPQQLPEAMRAVSEDAPMRVVAESLAGILAVENGPARAVKAMESLK